jgi:hypothetical protein
MIDKELEQKIQQQVKSIQLMLDYRHSQEINRIIRTALEGVKPCK